MEFWEIFSGDLHTLRTNGVNTVKGSASVKFRPTKLEASEVPQNQEKDDTKGDTNKVPSRELTDPTLGKGKSSSKVIFDGIC